MGGDFLDFNERCRLCIEPKRLSIDIFSEEGRKMKLENKINKHLSLKISRSDGLSNQVCYQCLFRLETWESFKQLCTEREQVMKAWSQTFTKNKINKVKEHKEHQPSSQTTNKCVNEKHSKSSHVKSSDPVMEPQRAIRTTLKIKTLPPKDMIGNSCVSVEPVYFERSFCKAESFDETLDDVGDSAGEAECGGSFENVECNVLIADSYPTTASFSEESYHKRKDHIKRKSRKLKLKKKLRSDPSLVMERGNIPQDDMNKVKTDVEQGPSVSNTDEKNIDENFTNSESTPETNWSPLPLKRKRGRPSKAFLKLERQYKRLKVKDVCMPSDLPSATEVAKSHVAQEEQEEEHQNTSLKEGSLESSQSLSQELVPVVNEESGVTEIVLNDPDFGSMKFTLSVVDIDSPPPPEDYRYHPEGCDLKEDFQGFENTDSSTSNFVELSHHQMSETLSRSLTDIRFKNHEDATHSNSCDRKRSTSVSGDFFGARTATSASFNPRIPKPCISKSLDNLHSDCKVNSGKQSYLFQNDRMSHSDEEVMYK